MIITAAAPACSAWTLSSTVSRVLSAPVPATTGTRPSAAFTTVSTSSLRSAVGERRELAGAAAGHEAADAGGDQPLDVGLQRFGVDRVAVLGERA